jgi:hypothetical protein
MMLPAYQGAFSRKIVASGVAGNGLDFDGVDDYVQNNSLVITPSLGFTIEGWMKINDLGFSAMATQTINHLPAPFDMYVNNGSGKVAFLVGQQSVSGSATSNTALTIGTWAHLAFVYDPAIAKVIIYLNGVQDGIGDATAPGNVVGSKFIIGNRYDNVTGLNGTLDDVRIWNVARTQAQIQATMNTELLGTETGLKAYYTFNQGIAAGNNTAITTVTDKTVNALNGTLTNFAKTGATSNFVVGKVESNIVTSGLVQNLSASNTASYSGSGGTAWNDLSGNNNNGTLSGPTYYSTVNGLSIPSLYFNGNGQFVSFGSSPPNFPTGDISVSVWINFSVLNNLEWNIFMTKWFGGSTADFHYAVKYNGTNYKQNLFTTNSSDLYGTSIIAANTWYCLGFTLKNSGDLQFYVNGVPDGKFTSVSRSNGNSTYYLGDYRPGPRICFTGYLNNVNLYNRTLNSDEMLNNYNATKAKYGL